MRWRLAPYFAALALPLVVGTWAFADYAASGARDRADARLDASLTAAVGGFRATVTAAAYEARALARSPAVQRAIARRDRSGLRRVAARNGHVAFFTPGGLLAGSVVEGAAERVAVIARRGRRIGSVAVYVPLDAALVARLAAGANLAEGQRLLLARHGRIGDRYRAAATRLFRSQDVVLAVVIPRERVVAAEWHSRRRVLLAGLAILFGVGLVAYALAPAFARARLSREQRAQAADVLSHVGDGVFLVDPDGLIRFWNPAAETITGVVAPDAVGRRPEALFRPWDDAEPRAPGLYDVSGAQLWLSLSAVTSPIGTVYAFRDLTAERRLEETRADFVATVSHELRTPLASIHGAANTLREREDLPAGRRKQLLEIVFEQSERLAHLVDQILLANQIDSGSVHFELEPFDAREVARRAVEAMQAGLPDDAALGIRAPDGLPEALGDAENTRRVLVNLIENAIRYSPAGGRIEVAVTQKNGNVRLSVRDEGLGIPPDEQGRIFEKFYRLDPGMSRGVGGSGLGLFICRELVALMGARLEVSSRPGVGSTFWFELPVTPTR